MGNRGAIGALDWPDARRSRLGVGLQGGDDGRATRGAVSAGADPGLVVAEAIAAFSASFGDRPPVPVTVVMPAFDEAATVADVVRSIPETACGLGVEVIVVDDGSRDRTCEAARDAGAMVCRLDTNLGQGWAFRTGYRLALIRGAEYIATIDADGQFDGAEIPALIAPLRAGEADFVNGSRQLGRAEHATAARRVGLIVFSAVLRALLGVRITDPANGLRAFRSDVVRRVSLRQAQYQSAELLITAVTAGFRVVEAPVTVYPRQAGETKKGRDLFYGAHFARVVITTWWRARREAGGGQASPAGRVSANREIPGG
jgi:GT2 family glycosyltransferase